MKRLLVGDKTLFWQQTGSVNETIHNQAAYSGYCHGEVNFQTKTLN